MHTGNEVQSLWISNMKTRTPITSLLVNGGSKEIREEQWQGTDFQYPAVRFSVTFYPSLSNCLDKAKLTITVFSEQKSSDEASTIAAAIQTEYHKKPFVQGSVQFPVVSVTSVDAPMRNIYVWESKVNLDIQIA